VNERDALLKTSDLLTTKCLSEEPMTQTSEADTSERTYENMVPMRKLEDVFAANGHDIRFITDSDDDVVL
jgi:hypothetical protein